MPFIKQIRGVLVESGEERSYSDGSGGRFVSLLCEGDQLLNAWLPKEVEDAYERPLEVMEVNGFEQEASHSFRIAHREWEGRTKRKIVEIGD